MTRKILEDILLLVVVMSAMILFTEFCLPDNKECSTKESSQHINKTYIVNNKYK